MNAISATVELVALCARSQSLDIPAPLDGLEFEIPETAQTESDDVGKAHASGIARLLSSARPPLTDLGNAERLVERHGRVLRYVRPWGWLVWDGRRWARDETGQVMHYAKEAVRSMLHEAAETSDRAQREALIAHARRSEAAHRLSALISCAQSEWGIAATADQFDRDPMLLNVRNGTLDLRTGQLRRHRPQDLITKLAPVDYDPGARSEVWERFLADITMGDQDLEGYLQRAVGYSLTAMTGEECFFVCYGTGRNGKTRFLEALRHVLGDYAISIRPETILAREGTSAVSNDIADLTGARLVITSESDRGKRLELGLVKRLTGGDSIRARFLHKEHFEFQPQLKLWLATNHLPQIAEVGPAIWERVKLVPFGAYFSEEQRDKHLAQKLQVAAGAILTWAVAGCLLWQRDGLRPPPLVSRAVQRYRAEQDPFARFLSERCLLLPDAAIGAAALLEAYNAWCEVAGEIPLTQHRLAAVLKEHGLERERRSSGVTYRSLALKPVVPHPDFTPVELASLHIEEGGT